MSNLTTKAMIVGLSVSQYTAKKFDKKVSKEVAASHNATEKAGRYNKNLFPFEAPSYEAIGTIAGEARRIHNYETLPWNDKGERILLATNHMNYSEKIRVLKAKFESTVPLFIDEYPTLKEWSKQQLNSMYREEDFPTLEKLKKKFSFSTTIMPLPDEADFRVKLQLEELHDVMETCRREVKSRAAEAMREPFRRLYEVVSTMAEKLNDPDATFHKTLVTNVSGITDHVLRALNLDDNEDLKEIGAKIQAGLCGFSPDMLRDNQNVREVVGRRSQEIMEDLRAFMGAG